MQFEEKLAQAETAADAALRAAAGVSRELKRARSAAAGGHVRDVRRGLEAAVSAANELVVAVEGASRGFQLDAREALGSGAWAKEVLEAAAAAGVAVFEEDDRLLCYPSIVRVLPADEAIEVDKRRERRLRPTVVVAALKEAQQRGPRFKAETFLESLVAAYDFVVAAQGKPPGSVVRLVDVHRVLTLLPGQARDYSKQEFARDLYLLDQSGVATTGDDRAIRWSASSGTRQSGVLTTVSRHGQPQRYWGVAFAEAAS